MPWAESSAEGGCGGRQALNICDWMLKSGVGAFIGLLVGRFAP